MAETTTRRKARKGGLGETIRTIIYAVLIALVVRTFLFEPFNIPSGSMIPTLLVGDYLFVSKYSYGYSRYSFPFGPPLFEGRILEMDAPARGDVAVFKLPRDQRTDYIKRIIGLPGDRIQVREGRLYINDTEVPRERLGDFDFQVHGGREMAVPLYAETLPGGATHRIIEVTEDRGPMDNTRVYTVPEDHYFVMGDNRDRSQDSRVIQALSPSWVGFVPVENLVGRAEIIFFSVDESTRWWEVWKWPAAIRWNRLGMLIQ